MREVASGIAYRAVRNRGTIGGSIVHADPAADWSSFLLCADARVHIHGSTGARVHLAIRFRIQGGLAQFNRGDLDESFADVVLAEFVRNCERAMAGEETRSSAGGLALL